MEFKLIQDDPLNILASTKVVLENAKHVFINQDNLQKSATIISDRFKEGLGVQEMSFSVTGNIENDVQLVFIEDAVNFCFWADKNEPKWQVEIEEGKVTEGGWYGLSACFKRSLKEGVPILNANYLAAITFEQVKYFFRGVNNIEIPLLKERMNNLQEAGRMLIEKFNGKFINVLEQSNYDAINLANLVIDNFPSFKDVSRYNGSNVHLFKRAQILPNDINYVIRNSEKKIGSLNKLTAFADYKLPQILRMYGILEYSKELAEKVDNYIEIPHDSPEEIEIRAATVWSVELLRQISPDMTAGNIDNTMWLLSQDLQNEAKPYHRTRTIYY